MFYVLFCEYRLQAFSESTGFPSCCKLFREQACNNTYLHCCQLKACLGLTTSSSGWHNLSIWTAWSEFVSIFFLFLEGVSETGFSSSIKYLSWKDLLLLKNSLYVSELLKLFSSFKKSIYVNFTKTACVKKTLMKSFEKLLFLKYNGASLKYCSNYTESLF